MSKTDNSVIKDLEKRYGVRISPLDAEGDEGLLSVEVIPSGLIPLDIATGIGGIPLGYFVEIYSPDGVGKTSLCIQIVAQAQKMGIGVAYIDMEHRFDMQYATSLGVDLSTMYFTQPPNGDSALNIARALIDSGVARLVIVDSVSALVPKVELDGEIGDQHPGLQARLIAQNLRMMTPILKSKGATVIFTNQLRAKMGGFSSGWGAEQTITSGGFAMKFYTSMRMEMRKIKTLKDGDTPYGHIARVTIRKNSLGVPLRTAELTMRFGKGFDSVDGLIDTAMKFGIIEKSGSWYALFDEKYHGYDRLYEMLVKDNAVYDRLYKEVISIHGLL